jgi:hypothetical protein
LGSFCAKLLRQINICDQSAPKMCAKFCSSRCSAPKIFRKYTLKFTLGKMYKLMKIIGSPKICVEIFTLARHARACIESTQFIIIIIVIIIN